MKKKLKVILASDHAGFDLKEKIKEYLRANHYEVEDVGTHSNKSVNWAEYGAKAAGMVSKNPDTTRGIIVCGSGIGMSMVSNKFKGVRSALCQTQYSAKMSRQHNNANVLNIGARVVSEKRALRIVEVWLKTEFQGGRHKDRLDYLQNQIEKNNFT